MSPQEILQAAKTILVIDWPSKDVPESLARVGFEVMLRGGPGPEDYAAYEFRDGKVVVRRTGRAPESADLIFSYLPVRELPEIIADAKKLRAKAIWTQSGRSPAGEEDPMGCWLSEDELQTARDLTRVAGIDHVAAPYIGDVAREIQSR